jgi:hypothetical protein
METDFVKITNLKFMNDEHHVMIELIHRETG